MNQDGDGSSLIYPQMIEGGGVGPENIQNSDDSIDPHMLFDPAIQNQQYFEYG
jgi:hypothetical protein